MIVRLVNLVSLVVSLRSRALPLLYVELRAKRIFVVILFIVRVVIIVLLLVFIMPIGTASVTLVLIPIAVLLGLWLLLLLWSFLWFFSPGMLLVFFVILRYVIVEVTALSGTATASSSTYNLTSFFEVNMVDHGRNIIIDLLVESSFVFVSFHASIG